MSLIKTFLLLSLILLSWNSFADGGSMSGGGGGNGVICFQTEEEANSSFNSYGNLNDFGKTNFNFLETLDVWEYRLSSPLFTPLNNETPQNFLRRILEVKWKPLFPLLVKNLLLLFPMIEESEIRSHPSDNSHKIADYDTLEKDLPKGCRIVGIANRFSQSNVGYKPKVEIRWNLELYDSLGNNSTRVINQAALLLHELLYIMGTEIGDKNSYNSRALVRLLLSEEISEKMKKLNSKNQEIFLGIIKQTFKLDLLIGVFYNELDVEKLNSFSDSKVALNNHKRNESWKHLLELDKICHDRIFVDHKPDLGPLTIHQEEFRKSGDCILEQPLSEEEWFLLIAHAFSLEGKLKDFDSLIGNGIDPRSTLQSSCQILQGIWAIDLRFTGGILKAKSYCERNR